MNELLTSATITCPYCWEPIQITLDLSVDGQKYTEDCFVCCRPIVISYRAQAGTMIEVGAAPEDQ